MSPIKSIVAGYSFYFITSIRAYRSEYWWFIGFCFVAMMILSSFSNSNTETFIELIAFLAFSLPAITASVRRLHDTGRTGGLLLCGFIPMVGGLILLYLLTRPSDDDNQYGISPY